MGLPARGHATFARLPRFMLASVMGLAWCVAFVGAQLPAIAYALDVIWDAPADVCPDATDVQARVERTFGPRASIETQLVVEARVRPDGDQFRLDVRLGGSHDSDWSTLTAQSCEALAEATAVIAAALLPPALPPAQPPAPPPPPEPSVRVPLALDALFSAGVERGALPETSPALGAGIAFSLARVRFSLVGGAFWPREGAVSELPEARPEVGLFTVGASACYDFAAGGIFLSPCAWLEVGQLFAREQGLSGGTSGRALWLSPGASLAARIVIGKRWILSPEVFVFAPLRSTGFYVGPSDAAVLAHEAKALSVRGLLTFGVRFWSLEKLW